MTFCNKISDRQNETCLRNAIPFVVFSYFIF
jgi:hypothetical protein